MKLPNLGNGLLFNGALRLTTMTVPPTECRIHVRNEIQNEDVVTVCDLVKVYDGNEYTQYMGMLFDRDLELDENRVFRGKMTNNLVESDNNGAYAFFVKDIDAGLNNINTAWTDYSNWIASFKIVPNVAEVSVSEETNERIVKWGDSEFIERKSEVKFTPIYALDDEGNETTDIIKYNVDIGNGLVRYSVWVNGNYVHFRVNGNRYRMSLSANSVDRLVVQDIPVETVDF